MADAHDDTPAPTDDDTVQLTDFRLAGFLLARGAKFVGTTKNARNETVFMFDVRVDSNGLTAEALINRYPGSPEQRYDAACRTMADFVRLAVGRRPR